MSPVGDGHCHDCRENQQRYSDHEPRPSPGGGVKGAQDETHQANCTRAHPPTFRGSVELEHSLPEQHKSGQHRYHYTEARQAKQRAQPDGPVAQVPATLHHEMNRKHGQQQYASHQRKAAKLAQTRMCLDLSCGREVDGVL